MTIPAERLHQIANRFAELEARMASAKIDTFLSDGARAFFDAVTSGLDAAGVKWVRAL